MSKFTNPKFRFIDNSPLTGKSIISLTESFLGEDVWDEVMDTGKPIVGNKNGIDYAVAYREDKGLEVKMCINSLLFIIRQDINKKAPKLSTATYSTDCKENWLNAIVEDVQEDFPLDLNTNIIKNLVTRTKLKLSKS